MKIKDLPNGIKELAEKRLQEDGTTCRDSSDYLVGDFTWSKTKEGHTFWYYINGYNFSAYEDEYPAHNWIGDYLGEYYISEDNYLANLSEANEFFEFLITTPAVLANGYYAGEGVSQEIKDAWKHGYEYANRLFTEDVPPPSTNEGIKEDSGKLSYELDWEFIEAMAARMSKNKGKYEPYNWKKPIEVEKLKQSLIRHVVEIMKDNYSDDGDEFGHLSAVSLNVMMLNYQLKNKEK